MHQSLPSPTVATCSPFSSGTKPTVFTSSACRPTCSHGLQSISCLTCLTTTTSATRSWMPVTLHTTTVTVSPHTPVLSMCSAHPSSKLLTTPSKNSTHMQKSLTCSVCLPHRMPRSISMSVAPTVATSQAQPNAGAPTSTSCPNPRRLASLSRMTTRLLCGPLSICMITSTKIFLFLLCMTFIITGSVPVVLPTKKL